MHGRKEIISTRKLNFHIRRDRVKNPQCFQVSPIPCRGKAEKSLEPKLARLQCKAEHRPEGLAMASWKTLPYMGMSASSPASTEKQ